MSALKVISGIACAVAIFAVLGIDYFVLHSHLAYFLFFLFFLIVSSIELCRIAGVKSRWGIFLSAMTTVALLVQGVSVWRIYFGSGLEHDCWPPFPSLEEETLQIIWRTHIWGHGYTLLALLVAALVLPPLLSYKVRVRTNLRDIVVPVFAAVYIGYFGAFLLLPLNYCEVLIVTRSYPLGFCHAFLLWFICTTKANDILGYLLGSSIGKHPLNSVSPKKTVEGSVAGLIGGIFISLLIVSLFLADHFSWYHAVLFGIIVGVAAQLGDLAESLIKRLCGVKDSGNLIPGSGGALDFIDCFLFAAPVAYYFLLFM